MVRTSQNVNQNVFDKFRNNSDPIQTWSSDILLVISFISSNLIILILLKQVMITQALQCYPFTIPDGRSNCRYEPLHEKKKKICAPSEDSDQPGHPPSLIRVFAVRSMGSWRPNVSQCGQRRL